MHLYVLQCQKRRNLEIKSLLANAKYSYLRTQKTCKTAFFSLLLYVKLYISTYCYAKSVGILGLRFFKQIQSIFTLEHEKQCKTAVSITFISKLCISTYCNAKSVGILGLRVFKQILSIFTLEKEKHIYRLFLLLSYVKLCISK